MNLREDKRASLRPTLTFWLRPYFVLRVVNRFQKVAGFDRAVALASSALTAMIPVAILVSVLVQEVGGKSTADRIISRYDLTGGGAEAVRDIFSPATGSSTSIGVMGALFLLVAALSFTRSVQRLFEQTWELKPLSMRNTLNGLEWAGGLGVYLALSGAIHAWLGRGALELVAALVVTPLAAAFLIWSGQRMSAGRLSRRELLPFGLVGAALLAVYSVGATVYLPHLFNTYATRYGVIGAVFAMISALFCVMVVLVASAAAGREIHDELVNIRAGRVPADDEVHQQWDELLTNVRSQWAVQRRRLGKRGRAHGEQA